MNKKQRKLKKNRKRIVSFLLYIICFIMFGFMLRSQSMLEILGLTIGIILIRMVEDDL